MRRLIWIAGCALSIVLTACQHPEPTGERTVAGVRFVERFTAGADARAPLVIGLHGMGDRPEHFARIWEDIGVPLELAFPQAPLAEGGGWAWYAWPRGLTQDQLADTIAGAEAALWPAIVELAHGRKVIVTGFSQGGVLAYAIAARHPDAVAYAVPISGRLPPPLWPKRPAAPVYALHGTDDPVIEIELARAAISGFRAAGGPAELREQAGVGHTITPAMHDDVVAHLIAAARAAQ